MPHRSRYAADPVIKPLLPGYLGRLAEHLRSIQAYRQAGNTGELLRVLHQLKGSGTSYGFEPLSALAALAEHQIKTDSLASATAQLEALDAYVRGIEGFPG